jgi:tripartite-type tricarboxylate transporter receptor subunit TctC
MTRHLGARIALLVALICASFAHGQDYPNRPIRWIVASAAGGSPDFFTRLYAQEVGKQMGQQIVVDNRPGASGSIGYELVAKAPKDGYTLGYATFLISTNPSLIPNLRYDALKDFQMVMQTGSSPNLLAVGAAIPVKSVTELIDHARRYPGKLMFGSTGIGTSMHLGMELLMSMTGVQMVHVPYKGSQQAAMAIIGGELHLIADNITPILPHVKAGRLRGLAVTSAKRASSVPDLPTVAEAGVPGFEIAPWGGVMVPAGVPKAIIARLNAEFSKALVSATLREAFAATGVEPIGGTPEQFTEHVRKEIEKWGALIQRLGIKNN